MRGFVESRGDKVCVDESDSGGDKVCVENLAVQGSCDDQHISGAAGNTSAPDDP